MSLDHETRRSRPEWVGATPDSAIPKSVRLRIWARENGRCWLTGKKILVGDAFDYEHKRPLALGGENRESNIALALRDKHREKTAVEAGQIAKADRVRAKHLGVWPQSKRRIKSRGFDTGRRSTEIP